MASPWEKLGKRLLFAPFALAPRRGLEPIRPGYPPARVLIIRPDDRIGNLVLLLPLLDAIHQAWPGVRVDLLLARVSADLIQGDPRVARTIVFDKFHLISNLGEVIDRVRRRTQAQANAEGRAFLKGQRYNLLRNPENLSPDGRRQLDLLLAANRDLSIAYMLKDAFKAVWTYTYRKCADKRLTGGIAMAAESGIAELKRFARGLVEAKEQILNFCQHRITSARIEAFNTIVSRVIHKACGVANLDFLFLKLRQESLQR